MTKLSTLALALLAACSASSSSDEADDTAETEQAIGATAKRWPGNTIYYYIDLDGHHANTSQPNCDMALPESLDSDDLDGNGVPDVKDHILEAFARYEAQTPLRFAPLGHAPTTFEQKAVLIFTRGDYDNPHAGGTPAGTASDYQGCVYLPDGDSKPQTVQHEIGHDLGMMHEQRRSDRNSYVTYDPTCVQAGHDQAFAVTPTSENLTPYDYDSIMEYASSTFCDTDRPACVDAAGKCKKPALLIKGCNDYTNPACLIEKHEDFSAGDLNALYRMYEPSLGTDEPNDLHGAAMAAADFDGDGYDDLAVGSPGEAPVSDPTTGAVMLYKGTEGGLVAWKLLRERDFASATIAAGDRFGAALAAGDFDGDGDAELMVGAPGYKSGAGAVFRYNGHRALHERTGPTAGAIYNDPSPSSGANGFGSAVALGKVNGTQVSLVVGAPSAAKFSTRNGMVFLRVEGGSWSSLSPDNGGPIGYLAGINFGAALAIGNFTSATSGGLAVGAPSSGFVSAGRVFIYNGATTPIGTISAPTPQYGDLFGKAITAGRFFISPATDLVAVGAPGESNGGLVTINYVTTSSISRLATYTEASAGLTPEAGDMFGASLASGDIQGTGGRPQLVIGAPGEDQGQGIILVNLASGWVWRGEQNDGFTRQAGDRFGSSLAVGKFGDVNDDPATRNDLPFDIAAGAPNRAPNGVANAGAFQWFFGQFSSTPVFAAGFDQARTTPE